MRINPIPVDVKNDVGAGDIFTTAYVCFRHLNGEAPETALDQALKVTAAHVGGECLTPSAEPLLTRSWAETSL